MEAVPATGARSHVPIERSLALASIELNLKQRKKGADFDVHLMSAVGLDWMAGQSPSRAAFIAASSIANHLMNTIPKLRGIGISAADRSTSGKIERCCRASVQSAIIDANARLRTPPEQKPWSSEVHAAWWASRLLRGGESHSDEGRFEELHCDS
ncbi:hypothetical protein FIBSPDRAFT_905596 [Athelia psychrophila]|uniref:Uncharacterized protein n=1 Tax=Athelia psychrophila TaxID=1759441 RepID=A0A167TA71_9AGAM|nr:hypothetical protein FIBSPDRAFT_905596 [Fibularhizoctonia sp. CBS 109695]